MRLKTCCKQNNNFRSDHCQCWLMDKYYLSTVPQFQRFYTLMRFSSCGWFSKFRVPSLLEIISSVLGNDTLFWDTFPVSRAKIEFHICNGSDAKTGIIQETQILSSFQPHKANRNLKTRPKRKYFFELKLYGDGKVWKLWMINSISCHCIYRIMNV